MACIPPGIGITLPFLKRRIARYSFIGYDTHTNTVTADRVSFHWSTDYVTLTN